MLVEIFLKFLVCIVYIELLEVINLKVGGAGNHSTSIFHALTNIYTGEEKKKNLKRNRSVFIRRDSLPISQLVTEKNSCLPLIRSIPQSFRIQRCQECQWI